MHYVPDSACELLRDDYAGTSSQGVREFHHRSAPLYALAVVVGGLLLADALLGAGWFPEAAAWRIVLGYPLALWAALFGGARILYHTLDGLVSGRVGADLALTVACLGAIVLGEHHTAGLVVFIALVGESIEGYTVDRARRAVRDSFALQPPLAHLMSSSGERDVPTSELRAGDVVAVRPGERIPGDGRVTLGRSSVDESAFTGEAVPVGKLAGDAIWAGTYNQFGALQIQIERVGPETTLGQITALVEQATKKKSRGERLADRLATWFLPAVLVAAALTLCGWRASTGSWQKAWMPALAVLVVACPCPLVLATPCAVLATIAGLARRGVIVKGAAAIERLATVDAIAFDKTGTLTQGAMSVAFVQPVDGVTKDVLLAVAAAAERRSEHLLARVIIRAAESAGSIIPAPYEFTAHPGAGVVAQLRSSALQQILPEIVDPPRMITLAVGTPQLLEQHGVRLPAAWRSPAVLAEAATSDETLLCVAADGRFLGQIGVRDTVREESAAVLHQLRALGIDRFALLTGDRRGPAAAVLRELPRFEHVAVGQSPAEKADWVRSQLQSGRRVAMVGDGVNDAPALAVADVGLVIGRPGADLTAAAGDILLLGDPLRPLPGLIRGARAMVANIQQSILWFAFGINGCGALASSCGWLDPVTAALFHEVASLAVMLNALRLLWSDDRNVTRSAEVSTPEWSARLATLAEWLSPATWVNRLLEQWRLTARLAIAGGLILWLAAQWVSVTAEEQVLVMRFGQHLATLDAGWHWRWPWPFEQLIRIKPEHVQRVTLGFRQTETVSEGDSVSNRVRSQLGSASLPPRPDGFNAPDVIEWTSDHGRPGFTPLPDEALFLTGDELLVDITAELQYRLADPQAFLFRGGAQVDALLRAELESVLRELTAAYPLDAWLTDARSALEQRVKQTATERIARLNVGVDVLDVQLLDVHPPQPVVAAYRQVADALEDRERQKNAAAADAARTLISAAGPAVLPSPTATSLPELTDETWAQWRSGAAGPLSGTAAAKLEAAHSAAVELREQAAGQADRLGRLQAVARQAPALSATVLYWGAITPLLSHRALAIIDPQAVTHQHWWLADPATNSPPPWMMPPPPRAATPNKEGAP